MGTTHITTGENKSAKAKTMGGRIAAYLFLALVTFLSLFPMILLLINSTRSNVALTQGFSIIPGDYFIKNLTKAWNDTALFTIPRGMLNSFIIAACASLLPSYFSAMTAYGIHVYDFKLKKVAFNFIMVIMMIPTQISAVGFVQLVGKFNMYNTYWPMILPAIAAPSVFFYMKQYMQSSMPLEVIEAARVDGSNEFMTFNTIALPMLKPALAVQMIFAFVASWNNFFTPALVLSNSKSWTLPIMISVLRSNLNSNMGDLGEVYMMIMLSIIPVVIVYFFISKYIVQGVALGAVKG
ncbi:MAG: carbohydrate ABC transporter permease [Ruminiclostridium sp.]|nr:carbohydrate ABC transporter permease [Ruminiclostridium sp.]